MNDICCIGHITLDKIITPKQTIYMPGGTSYYFSHGIISTLRPFPVNSSTDEYSLGASEVTNL